MKFASYQYMNALHTVNIDIKKLNNAKLLHSTSIHGSKIPLRRSSLTEASFRNSNKIIADINSKLHHSHFLPPSTIPAASSVLPHHPFPSCCPICSPLFRCQAAASLQNPRFQGNYLTFFSDSSNSCFKALSIHFILVI